MHQRQNSYYENDAKGKIIELFVKCKQLIKSNSYVIVKMQKQNFKDISGADSWAEIGRTNAIANNINPNFADSFIVEYKFEEYQPILLEVWEYVSPSESSLQGKAECSLGELVKQKNQTLSLNLTDANSKVQNNTQKRVKQGEIIVRYDEVFKSDDVCLFTISTKKTNPSELFSFSRLFLRILRKTEAAPEPLLIYESTKAQAGAEINSKTIKLKGQKLCNSDYNVPVIFQVWSVGLFGSEELVGVIEASLIELKQKLEDNDRDNKGNQIEIPLRLNNAASGRNRPSLGYLVFHKAAAIQVPSFLDYLRSGTRINLVLGIDFTASNLDPSGTDSLHYIDRKTNSLNQYQRAIRAVGDILIEYDDDKLVPSYGFGAEIKGKTEHAFPLSSKDTELEGIQEVFTEYTKVVLRGIKLSGPTFFSPLIEKVMESARKTIEKDTDEYYVLLILTDGQIHDMESTKRLIVDSAKLPLSIIIIGVGQDEFTNMHELDGDDGLVDSRGRSAARDLVQFVEFRQFEGNDYLLQKEVLQELPDQVVEYNLLCNRLPNGFEKQRNVNYLDFTRIAPQDQQNINNQTKSSFYSLFQTLIVIVIGIILLNIIFWKFTRSETTSYGRHY